MEKKLKKCYRCLDLPYSATVDEIKRRERALVKIFNSKAKEKKASYTKQIQLVESSAFEIIENIKNNGVPTEENHCFEVSNTSIIGLIIVFAFALFMCFMSFYAFKL